MNFKAEYRRREQTNPNSRKIFYVFRINMKSAVSLRQFRMGTAKIRVREKVGTDLRGGHKQSACIDHLTNCSALRIAIVHQIADQLETHSHRQLLHWKI
jgi:hypothetical protein